MIVHTILYVTDQQKSRDFYQFVLAEEPTLDVPGMTEFRLSEQHVLGLMPEKGIRRLLGDALPDPATAHGVPRAELYLRVAEPEHYHQRAAERGARELSPIAPREWGDRAGYLLDPDGHVLAFAASRINSGDQIHFQQPTLETPRLTLTPYGESDLADVLAYASHPEVTRFVPWEQHRTLGDSRKFLTFIRSKTSTLRGRLFFIYAIRLRESGRVIGSIDFKNVHPQCGQIDYALGYDFWNQGFMSEAAAKIRDWSFEALPEMVRLQAFCVPENRGSRRVMEKIGMQNEGLRRKVFNLKGKMVDLVDYSLIRGGV